MQQLEAEKDSHCSPSQDSRCRKEALWLSVRTLSSWTASFTKDIKKGTNGPNEEINDKIWRRREKVGIAVSNKCTKMLEVHQKY